MASIIFMVIMSGIVIFIISKLSDWDVINSSSQDEHRDTFNHSGDYDGDGGGFGGGDGLG